MARRRTEALDTSDPLSSGVMVGLSLFILGVLGVLYVMNSRDALMSPASSSAPATEAVVASQVPVVPGEDGTVPAGTAGQDIDGDGDTAADSESGAAGQPSRPRTGDTLSGSEIAGSGVSAPAGRTEPGTRDGGGVVPSPRGGAERAGSARPAPDEASGPGGQPGSDAGTAGDGGPRITMPDRAGGRGLFSADDPERIPAITVDAIPRDAKDVRVDLDDDGTAERVWAAIVRNQVQTRVEHVVNGVWMPGRMRTGAAADRLVALRVEDLTGDGRPEVYTRQRVATEGESVTLWSYRAGELVRMQVVGGCWNGSNTVGIVGALVRVPSERRPTLAAVCRVEGLPPHQWSSAIYVWRNGQWEFDRVQGRYQ